MGRSAFYLTIVNGLVYTVLAGAPCATEPQPDNLKPTAVITHRKLNLILQFGWINITVHSR